MPGSSSPIGIFDSGIGGLTVAKAVAGLLPNEDILYFGDTARVPYGIKSDVVIRRYSEKITRFLTDRGVKMILVACNSVSATALKAVTDTAAGTPVLNVIEAGTEAAAASGAQTIGVIGTLATIRSGAYEKALRELLPDASIHSKACPLLVPLAEEGWTENDIARMTLHEYLAPYRDIGIEAIILGCTHYPLFTGPIRSLFAGKPLMIIDSAESIARAAKQALHGRGLASTRKSGGRFHCFVSDRPQRFHELAERFLGRKVDQIEVIDLE